MLLDFHTHTTASDGALSPAQLLARARERQIALLAITDHDTVAGYRSLLAPGERRPGDPHLVAGTELSCRWSGTTVHVVGLGMDCEHPAMREAMDTLATDSVKKTILLTTSPYTRLFRNPVRIDLDVVQLDLGLEKSSTPSLPVAVLLEGRFRSAFADRLLIRPEDLKELGYREEGARTAQLVVSDGDVIANRVDRRQGMYFTLGYDRYAQAKIYGNKEFLINAVNYLLDDQALISVRSRAIGLRKLDPERIVSERGYWQVLNVALPIALGLLIGGLSWWLRRRRYARAA